VTQVQAIFLQDPKFMTDRAIGQPSARRFNKTLKNDDKWRRMRRQFVTVIVSMLAVCL